MGAASQTKKILFRVSQPGPSGSPRRCLEGHEQRSHYEAITLFQMCEYILSVMKTKSRNHLYVRRDIRLAVSTKWPNVKGIVRRAQVQVSHWLRQLKIT